MENKKARFEAFVIRHHRAIDRTATAIIGVSCVYIGFQLGRIHEANKTTKQIQEIINEN